MRPKLRHQQSLSSSIWNWPQQHRKNVVIHQRDAWDDTMKILRPYSSQRARRIALFQWITGAGARSVELGHYISFTGIVTFKNAADLRQAAVLIPLDRIMVETDSPYLAPVPYRGKRCEPAFVRETAESIAAIRSLTLESFSEQTTKNAERFFGF